jgi:hypothetical protein
MAFKMKGWSAFTKETRMEGTRGGKAKKEKLKKDVEPREDTKNYGQEQKPVEDTTTSNLPQSKGGDRFEEYPQTIEGSRLEYEPQSKRKVDDKYFGGKKQM